MKQFIKFVCSDMFVASLLLDLMAFAGVAEMIGYYIESDCQTFAQFAAERPQAASLSLIVAVFFGGISILLKWTEWNEYKTELK